MLYGKSKPIQSIKEHTDGLLNRLEILKKTYGEEILKDKKIDKEMFWKTLKFACLYHDTGKAFTPFQNMILEKLGETRIKTEFEYNVKHEQLSPLFIPLKELELDPDYEKILLQSIFFHHERNNIESLDTLKFKINNIIEKDILPRIDMIEQEVGINIKKDPNSRYLTKMHPVKIINSFDKLYIELCLIKGLLHRLDHSASAGVIIEDVSSKEIGKFTFDYVNEKFKGINDIQMFCMENYNFNIIAVGSTGIGKTEAALLWINGSKAFFTLPIRVSINAIYDRVNDEIGYGDIGLLHSSSLEYMLDKKNLSSEDESTNLETPYEIYEQSKNFSKKLTICTINQIFAFVFKYPGYEKIYSTLSYSKIVIDEIQAYSPKIVAIILKGLTMINDIGGKFMIMTATLPRIYKEYLEEHNIEFKINYFENNLKRHYINLKDEDILDNIDFIKSKSKKSKILIIANTVNKAIEIYKSLKEQNIENLHLLHSRFTQEDKGNLENGIKTFSKDKEEPGIWVVTQIVEASLDIDFDYLFTEMPTLDSLFQRFGRCYRSREYIKDEPNIFIYTKNSSGIGSVYDKEIYYKSIELLRDCNNRIVLEKEKFDMVDLLYSKENLKGTEFFKKYKEAINRLDSILDYKISKAEAQEILNEIDTIKVIPEEILNDKEELFEKFRLATEIKEKMAIKREIDKYTINVRYLQVKGDIYEIVGIKDVFVVHKRYDKEIGLVIEKDIEYEMKDKGF